MAGLLTIIVVYGGLIGAIVLLSKADSARASRKCRAAALPLGLTVRDVEREVPISRDRGRTWELEMADIAEYRLAPPTKASTTWRLLARAGEQHGDFHAAAGSRSRVESPVTSYVRPSVRSSVRKRFTASSSSSRGRVTP